ncbi:MAG: YihY family inner membrane protein [Alistipes sp.]|nr:YihY family inner membrane protein [Alistipes sp.]
MIKKLIEFFRHGLWQKSTLDENGKPQERWFIRPFRISAYTISGLAEHGVGVRAAALTMYTLMSIVPVAALIFGIVKGFGLESSLNDYLYTEFPQYSTIIDNVIEFANNMLMRTRGGIVASVGFLVLFWSVIKVFGNVEKAFNNIWEIKKQRSLARKFSDYVTVVVVAPILWLVSSGLVRYVRIRLETLSGSTWFVDILFGLLSLVVLWLMFAFVYYVMPNTKVKFRGALVAGIIAGTCFQIFQVGYVLVQKYITSYNVIYGSFAALPLFLIWLQASWMILLVGAELSFAYQNISQYEQERESLHMSYDNRRKVMLAAMLVIVKHYTENRGPVNSEQVAAELNMPTRIVRDVIFDMENAGLVAGVVNVNDEKTDYYIPAKDAHNITVSDVIDGVEGSSTMQAGITYQGNESLNKVTDIVDSMKELVAGSRYNVKLTDLTDTET